MIRAFIFGFAESPTASLAVLATLIFASAVMGVLLAMERLA